MKLSPGFRQRSIARMDQELFDVAVIGGGITGAGIARDAALRGLSVALVEKEDYASGTSGKTSRMVHGGLRYLEQFQFGIVAEACAERRRLREAAPRLVRPTPFTFPVYDGRVSLGTIRLGMWLYDGLSLFRNYRRHRMLDPGDVADLEPALGQHGLVGGARYYDCRTDDARLTLLVIKAAQQSGALTVNHAQVVDLLKGNGGIRGIRVVDRLRDEAFAVRARVTVNATGAWCDTIRHMDDPAANKVIYPSRGSHLVFPRERLGVRDAIIFTGAGGGRATFVVPWRDTCIVGTTDREHSGDLDQVFTTPREAEAILAATNRAFPEAEVGPKDIISTFSGVRPLVTTGDSTAYQISRAHRIFESDSGLVSIAGGKLTTYRRMAEDLVDHVVRRLARDFGTKTKRGCMTDKIPLEDNAFDARRKQARLTEQYPGLPADALSHLCWTYGPDCGTVLAICQRNARWCDRIVDHLPYLQAEIPYAVECETAATLNDFMMRRTNILYEDEQQGEGCAPGVAATMANLLEWDSRELERQLARYAEEVALTRMFRGRA